MRALSHSLGLSAAVTGALALWGCEAPPPSDEQVEHPSEDSKGVLTGEDMVGLIAGKVPVRWGFVNGNWQAGWVVGDGRDQENLAAPWVSEVYVMCREDGYESCPMEVAPRGENIFATAPRDGGYSPYWQVVRVKVPNDYVDSSLKSEALILDSGWETERLPAVVNCPLHTPLAWLEDGAGVISNLAWYDGYSVNYWDFGFVEMDDAVIPAAEGYVLHRADEPLSELSAEEDLNQDGDQADTNNIFVLPEGQGSARVELTRVDVPEDAVASVDVASPDDADYRTVDSLENSDADVGEVLGFVNFGLHP